MRRKIGTILLLGGSAALVWCATVWVATTLFEAHEARRWNARSPAAAATAPTPPRAEPALHDVIAWIEIPRLHISTAVLEGDDDLALQLGAGHVPGTPLPGGEGNSGIAAHRDSFFRSLGAIQPHDRIHLRTPGGDWQYAVESTSIVEPSDTGVLANGHEPELTLVTCYPFRFVGAAPLRFIVHARRVG